MRPLPSLIFMSRWLQVPLYLGLIDVVMISNRLIMAIIGGYETFVSRLGIDGHPDERMAWVDRLTTHTHPGHFHETHAPVVASRKPAEHAAGLAFPTVLTESQS